MPNIKSAKKRVLVEKRNSLRNRAVKSEIKTSIKKFDGIIAEGNKEQAQEFYREISGTLDSAVLKGIIPKNYAARKKSAFSKKVNKLA